MPVDLERVDTVVLLMFENRSFDHLLGYLGAANQRGTRIEGLRLDDAAWMAANTVNPFGGKSYAPFALAGRRLASDLPHGRDEVLKQLGPLLGGYSMKGFAGAYLEAGSTPAAIRQAPPAAIDPLAYCTPSDVPVSHFLAENYAVCDHWFASLPTDTFPNRLMAWSGYSRIDSTSGDSLPNQTTLLDWANQRVRWRVYHDGPFSFFDLMHPGDILSDGFRSLSSLADDVANEAPASFPQLIVIEPEYDSTPWPFRSHPNDNHPPLDLARGEALLQRVYQALTRDAGRTRERWAKTVFLVYYDEHGGFFDHVEPPNFPTYPPDGEYQPFASYGVRVPAIVVSPLVAPASVFPERMDHLSVLKLLAERFTPGVPFSSVVAERPVCSLGDLLAGDGRQAVPECPAIAAPEPLAVAATPPVAQSAEEKAFDKAKRLILATNPTAYAAKFPAIASAHPEIFRPPQR